MVQDNVEKIDNGKENTNHSRQVKREKKQELQTKVVIRHLPPSMTDEQFLDQISPVPDHNYFYFAKADTSLGQYAFCRAYINFTHQEDIFLFKDKFDGYVFVDTKGNEYPAIVEFAPFQKIPRRRVGPNGMPLTHEKRDTKCNTIENDPEYIKFLENLEKAKTEANLPSAEIYVEEIENRDKELKANHGCLKITTPLIEFIKQKKAEKIRLREERREERKKQQELKKQKDEERRQKERSQQIRLKEREKKDCDREKEKPKEKEKEKDAHKLKEKEKERETEKERKEKPRERRERGDRDRERNKRDSDREKERRKERSDVVAGSHRKVSQKERKDEKQADTPTFTVKVFQNSDKGKVDGETKAKKAGDGQERRNSTGDAGSATGTTISSTSETKEIKKKTDQSKDEKSDDQSRRRRLKDRPALEIYRPAARRVSSGASETKERNDQTSANSGTSVGGHRDSRHSDHKDRPARSTTKVFTRSKHTD